MASRNRGKPKPKLRDLSREHPTSEEETAAQNAFVFGPPMVAAILGTSQIEMRLEISLRRRLQIDDDGCWAEMLADNGPLNTFHSKIVMGHALKIFGTPMKENLNIVRNIRNAFAHAKKVIDFSHPLIVSELKSVSYPREKSGDLYDGISDVLRLSDHDGRASFVILIMCIDVALLKRQTRLFRDKTNRIKRRYATKELASGLLFSRSMFPKGFPGLLSLLSGDYQADGPTNPTRELEPPSSGLLEPLPAGTTDKSE